ncbi:MAG: Na+/H+ antiporter NhaC family protein [Acidobacteriota bacterium]
MKKFLRHALIPVVIFALCQSHLRSRQQGAPSPAVKLVIESPRLTLKNVPFDMTIKALREDGSPAKDFTATARVQGLNLKTGSAPLEVAPTQSFKAGVLTIQDATIHKTGNQAVRVEAGGSQAGTQIRVVPGILSLLPPLLAIAMAFITRQVLISLFCGIWLGALCIFDYNPLVAFMKALDTYLVNSLADPDHASILIFSLTLGGMVGVISKAGGTQGIVQKLSKYANHPRGGQLAAWAMGVFIFFDDYANTLIVGNTMRPFTDRLHISREKLSYIVDSTAAPVASVALVSTWIGFQVGLIDQAFGALKIEHDAYIVFIQSIPYASYSILAILFVFLVGVTLRDFGPMRRAEMRARGSGKVLRDGAQPLTDSAALDLVADAQTPLRWHNALVPILTVILVTLLGLYVSGRSELGEAAQNASLGNIIGAAKSFAVLMWASFTGLTVAILLALVQKILTLHSAINATLNGYKSMMLAAMILILAWAIGNICNDLRTADYVVSFARDILSPNLVPFVTFVAAAFIAFSTGTSWATMAILTPIVVPVAYKLPIEAGITNPLSHEILIGTVGAVLSGSVFGDHCSPISDTTIMSSMASAADHVDHVRTQLVYALLVASVACLAGYLPNGWGIHTYWSLLGGVAILTGIIFFFGQKTDPPDDGASGLDPLSADSHPEIPGNKGE